MSQNKDVPLREVLTLQLFFMRIDILTVLPEMIEGMINCSIVKRAQDKGLAEIHLHNLRDYTTNKWRRGRGRNGDADRTDRPGDLSVEKRTGI